MSLATAQELLNTQGANVLVLLLDKTMNTQAVVHSLQVRVETLGLELKTWDWLNDFYWKAVALYDRQFGVLRLIVLIMVILVGIFLWLLDMVLVWLAKLLTGQEL
jgi:putative ABC transport system permease protein